MFDYETFIGEGLSECLHLKFMQIETAFQENQLQLLKINDNFMKIQEAFGDDLDLDLEPIELDAMFEFTTSVLEDIQNKMLIQKSKTRREKTDKTVKSISKEIDTVDKDDMSAAYKSSSPEK